MDLVNILKQLTKQHRERTKPLADGLNTLVDAFVWMISKVMLVLVDDINKLFIKNKNPIFNEAVYYGLCCNNQ
ncbi:hypothetical protein [Aeromonas salmonicida]|uniref:hypothetical protein n=1 Tax=Aeromonas salmonicida TaxID=645 RepID=UPI0030CC35A6